MKNEHTHHTRMPDAALADTCRYILGKQGTAISIRDPHQAPVYINPAYERLFDITLEEWLHTDLASHLGEKAKKVILEQAQPTMDVSDTWKGELEVVTPKGAVKHIIIEKNRIRNEHGEVTNYFSTYFDVTKLKNLENSLHLQVDFLYNIIDTVPDPIFVKDEEHTWVVTNKAHCNFMGRDREAVIGKTDHDYFPKDEADIFWEKDDEVFATGEENINEELLTDSQGVTHVISTKKATFTQDDGQRILVGVIRNITEERRLSKALANSYNQLQGAFVDLQDRLRGVQAHIATEMTRTEAIQEIIHRSTEEFKHISDKLGHGLTQESSLSERMPRMSRREHQVFIMLAQGHRIKDIAEHLGLNTNTVSTYRSRIMKKLNISTMSELIQYALRSGLA